MPELIVSKNNKIFFRVPLSEDGLKIGRSSDNDLTLPDENISRNHAEIAFNSGGYVIKDTSRGGTRVNSKPVSKTSLADGAEVGIGSWILTFKQSSKQDLERQEEIRTCITRISTDSQTKILKLDPKKEIFIIEHPVLSVSTASSPAKKIPIEKEVMLIGSASGCDVVIQDDYVSSKHCQIKKGETGFILKDLGSTNGTLVQGSRIDESPLAPSLEFVIGKTKLSIQSESSEEKVIPLPEDHFCGLVGKTKSMRLLFSKIQKVAPSDSGVLIQGETGSGKELVARALHELSNKSQRPYIILNCGAISANLIESELFGHEKGAFTGAHAKRLGAFEEAQGGTLFLDEVGELPLELQPKLLRVLENQAIRRVGGSTEIPVNVRVIAATHRQLHEQVRKGKFREDLYFRLYVVPLSVPSLRDRLEDIPLLVDYFIRQACPDTPKSISPEALEKLASYDWPGNVRELKNVVLRALIFCEEKAIEPDNIEIINELSQDRERINLTTIEKEKIIEALKETDGNKTKAANILGIAKSTLFKKLKEYGISG